MQFGRFLQARDGSSAVEFALLSPFYLLLVFGMIAYGVYFGTSHSVQQIAADAARIAIAGLSEDEREDLANDYITEFSERYAFVDADALNVDFEESNAPERFFIVTVRLDARNLPIWQLIRDLPLPSDQIEKQAVIRIGAL